MNALEHHLGRVLHAHWRGGNRHEAYNDMRTAIATDPQLHAAAQARHKELTELNRLCRGNLKRRCAVSAVHLETLQLVLQPREEAPHG